MKINKIKTKRIMLIIVLFSLILVAEPAKADPFLTKEELDYIGQENIIKAVSLHGGAPIQYADTNGNVKGISKEVLEEICNMSGLVFEYQLYGTLDEVFNSDADITFGIPNNYTTDNMVLSLPYLKSQTILYVNSSLDSSKLDDKKYAAVKGSDLPEGIKKETAIYFDTREASLDAVEFGQADYGYGNSYSVAFYTLQNNYKNIITVPQGKESREYCIGFLKDNEILLSIINKSIEAFDETHMKTLVLNATTQIERKITLPMIIDSYGIQIFGFILLVMAVLLLSFIHNIRANNQLKIQNERYHILSQTSNEYLYEYYVRTKHLELSKNCIQLFGNVDNLSELVTQLENVLINDDLEKTLPIIELPTTNGDKGLFKSVSSPIYDDKGKIYSVIGKLIDISKEEEEKQELIKKSEIDGLTGLYNAITTRRLITERIINTDLKKTGALISIDCDKFKAVNDTYGHLQGDNVLINVSKAISRTFRKNDILGRIGGDEFCIYMQDIISNELVALKSQQLMDLILEINRDLQVTVSIGIALLTDEKSYEDLFKKSDTALYEAKRKGGDLIEFAE